MSTTTERQHDWLRIGAVEKAKSVLELTRSISHHRVIEIGCGSGALLEALAAQEFADSYFGIEPSPSLAHYAAERANVPDLTIDCATVETSHLASQRYDVGILSHVIEHVSNPAALIIESKAICDHLIVEIPLEGTFPGNARAHTRKRLTGRERVNNAAGHIAFFSPEKLDHLVTNCGGTVLARRLYVPVPQLKHQIEHGSRSKQLLGRMQLAGLSVLGHRVMSRAYYGHYAVLIGDTPPVPRDQRTSWPVEYFDEERHTSA